EEIRALHEEEIPQFVRIGLAAFPGFKMPPGEPELYFTALHRSERGKLYGYFREGRMLGGYLVYHYLARFHEAQVKAAGLAWVVVDLLHKKEQIARRMISFFHRQCRAEGTFLAMLFPFRADFYRKMGYGVGTRMDEYRIPPAMIPAGQGKERVRLLQEEDVPLLEDCYRVLQLQRHGLLDRTPEEFRRFFEGPGLRVVGVRSIPSSSSRASVPGDAAEIEEEERLSGYLAFSFPPAAGDNPLLNNLNVRELVYQDSETLQSLLAFLHSQVDQIERVIFHSQEEDFHALFADPRDASRHFFQGDWQQIAIVGLGVMYRFLDLPAAFHALTAGHDFGGVSARLRLTVRDSFLPEVDGSYDLVFRRGKVQPGDGAAPEVELTVDIADFSSLLMGSLRLRSLVRYNLVTLSDPAWLDRLDRLFRVTEKPLCMTDF
ncbi:MAG: GNAT family N-acetyltransferase, partial [candidate division NC10 bacterium]